MGEEGKMKAEKLIECQLYMEQGSLLQDICVMSSLFSLKLNIKS